MFQSRTREFTVTKLSEGSSYLFRVFAENDFGASDAAETDKPVTAKSPFRKFSSYGIWLVVNLQRIISIHTACFMF